MVSIQALTKRYGSQHAIESLTFEVQKGEILGFLGPNGAGKSTTMKILTGFLPPTSGTATVDGYDILTHPLDVRRRVGYLPENNPLYLDMYVHEFLAFVGRMYGLSGANLRQRITEVISLTGLGREQHKPIGALSKGYRQRVGLCQALIHDPEVLILDEPTTGLDPNQIVDIRALIRDVGQNKTVIFSSHILSEVEAIADRVIIINQGRIVADEATGHLRDRAEDEFIIHLEVAQAGFDLSDLQAMPGVRQVATLDACHFDIHTDPQVDIRQALFEACVSQGNAMLGLSRERYSLEDAFRKLTQ
jgi:ABC-2 type transport system ATP-binding protein